MADAHHDHESDGAVVGNGPAIAFSLVFILLGLGLAAFPLVWWDLQAAPNMAISAATYPVFHWIGLCFLVAGLSILIGKLIVFDAVGAGKAKFAGFELPIQVGGTAFLFLFLMLAFSFTSERYGLANVQARSQALIDQREAAIAAAEEAAIMETRNDLAKDYEEELVGLQSLMGTMEQELLVARAQRNTYRHLLLHQLDEDNGGVELLRLRFQCPDHGLQWIDWALPDADNNGIVESLGPGESPRQGHEVHGLMLDDDSSIQFRIRTARRTPIMDTTLSFEKDVVVATIRPFDVSLLEFCNTLDDHGSDTLARHGGDVRSTALELSNE